MVQPAVPRIPGGGTRPPDVNTQLEALARQWDARDPAVAASIRQYIATGWTTPVPREVQQAVSVLVGRQVPVMDVPRGANGAAQFNVPPGNAAPPPGYGAGPQLTGSVLGASALGASLPSIFNYTPPPPPNQTWPGQPPQATGTGYQGGPGGAQAVPDPNGLPVVGKGGGFFNTPPAAYNPPNQQGPGGYTNEQVPYSDIATAIRQGVRAGAAADTAAAGQRGATRPGGGQSVNPPAYTPSPGNPLTTPAASGASGPFGTIDPTSAIGQQGYAQAQAGDPTALSAVLTQLLGKFGIDVNRGGIFTPGLVSSLAPYLKTVMEYAGLANGGKPVIPSQIADQFGGMIGGANTFGQVQDFARGLLPQVQTMLGAPAGALADSSNQVGLVNDLLGMLTAGANPIYQQYQQGVNKKTLSDYVQSQLGGPTQNYIDWMRQNAGKMPGSDLLAQIIGASQTAGR